MITAWAGMARPSRYIENVPLMIRLRPRVMAYAAGSASAPTSTIEKIATITLFMRNSPNPSRSVRP